MYLSATPKFTFLNEKCNNEIVKEIEKEYPESRERLIKKVDWCTDDTIFLGGIILAAFATVLCFIM